MIGGANADVFEFTGNFGDERIMDFEAGVDVIDAGAYGVTNPRALLPAVSDTPEGVLLDLALLGGSGSVLLAGVRLAELPAGDVTL